ncbi:hypothetical protein C2G38_2230986 [Gigaspora rosea]|uniref:Uncharacterized protein n=1 Tax=Gigaspora rosea TaxID=44941 RepID=A0A397TWU9_9GLOM|nr:hypothetical protein C2G38_2230986 [Gigaspora rosea]
MDRGPLRPVQKTGSDRGPCRTVTSLVQTPGSISQNLLNNNQIVEDLDNEDKLNNFFQDLEDKEYYNSYEIAQKHFDDIDQTFDFKHKYVEISCENLVLYDEELYGPFSAVNGLYGLENDSTNKRPTILIVGAGICRLSLYQSIRKNLGQQFNVKIFERENGPEGVASLFYCTPPEVQAHFPETMPGPVPKEHGKLGRELLRLPQPKFKSAYEIVPIKHILKGKWSFGIDPLFVPPWIGDAAHAMNPTLGLSVNYPLQDAELLIKELLKR